MKRKFRAGTLAHRLQTEAYEYDYMLEVKKQVRIPKMGDWQWDVESKKEVKIAWDAIAWYAKNITAMPSFTDKSFLLEFYAEDPDSNAAFTLKAGDIVSSFALNAINLLEMIDRDDAAPGFGVNEFYGRTEQFISLLDLASEKLKKRLKESQQHQPPSLENTPTKAGSDPDAR